MSFDLTSNPFRAGLPKSRSVDPCGLVIFGGTGDLAYRKLFPALYRLHAGGHLPRGFVIVGYASQRLEDESYRIEVKDALGKYGPRTGLDGPTWESFARMINYVQRNDEVVPSLRRLKGRLDALTQGMLCCRNYLFYLAVPPFMIEPYVLGLGQVGLSEESPNAWRRLVVEKPFGEDLESARKLNVILHGVFREDQIYRIDHYLGKEAVQNILVFRFANQMFEPLLNSSNVDSIQITVAETVGVEGRGGYYDSAGALRDMIQNHVLQIASLLCMEPPTSLDAEAVRDAKTELLRCIVPVAPGEVDRVSVRAQYSAGLVDGIAVPGYRDEPKVAADSQTETYAALKLTIDNPRWRGVPVYLRTGKRLAKRVSEAAILLKPASWSSFSSGVDLRGNAIAIRIQPDEGISVRFVAKVPGMDIRIEPVHMDFRYFSGFAEGIPDAYERLLLDAMLGDTSLFARADATEIAWSICDAIRDAWETMGTPLYPYTPGTWGPREADEMLANEGRRWRLL